MRKIVVTSAVRGDGALSVGFVTCVPVPAAVKSRYAGVQQASLLPEATAEENAAVAAGDVAEEAHTIDLPPKADLAAIRAALLEVWRAKRERVADSARALQGMTLDEDGWKF